MQLPYREKPILGARDGVALLTCALPGVQIYFFSSFWGQFGPNCTTFLLAGELYPTEVRTTAHGISAGVAKLGALWAAIMFNYLDKRTEFWLTASFNVAGCALPAVFFLSFRSVSNSSRPFCQERCPCSLCHLLAG